MEKTVRNENLEGVVNSLSFEQRNRLLELSEQERTEMFNLLKQEQDERGKMYGDKKLLIEDLQKNHMTVEESVDKYGHTGKIIHLNLPAMGRFEGFKFDYFISDDVSKEDPSKELPKYEFFTANELRSLIKAVNQYMRVNGVKSSDWDREETSYVGVVKELLGWFDGKNMVDGDGNFCTLVYPMGNGDSFQMYNDDVTDFLSFKHKAFKYKLLLRG